MNPRSVLAAFSASIVTAIAAAALLLGLGHAQSLPPRQFFDIATGPSGGTYFPVGQTIAGLISNPPGVDRCQIPNACGPLGLIATARTSEGAVANVLAVNSAAVESGMAQSDVVDEAVKGTGAFRRAGKQTHIRVLASLFAEDLHLVASPAARISHVGDLRGKRVSVGSDSSGTAVTARAVLAAFGLSERDVKITHASADAAGQLLQQKKIDAFFFMGGPPVPLVEDLCGHRLARLVPIDGRGRDRLIATVPSLEKDTIAPGVYSGSGPTDTVRVRALWIVRDTEPAPLAYGILKSLFSNANRNQLDSAMAATRQIRIDDATAGIAAPLHPGAVQFLREVGKLPRAGKT